MTQKMQIVWDTLEAAKDAGDALVIAACRRCIRAHTLGWRRHGGPDAYAIVIAAAQ